VSVHVPPPVTKTQIAAATRLSEKYRLDFDLDHVSGAEVAVFVGYRVNPGPIAGETSRVAHVIVGIDKTGTVVRTAERAMGDDFASGIFDVVDEHGRGSMYFATARAWAGRE
jgi:hypothetical protein